MAVVRGSPQMNSSSITPVLTIEAARVEADPWAKPRPLSAPTPPILDLEKAIPPGLAPFREFCAAVAEALQVPPDAVPPLALALASIGTSRALELQLKEQWRETAPLWFAVLAESGERKSALLGLLAAPVQDWQRLETTRLRDALASYAERREALAARLVATRGRLSKFTGPDREALENETHDLSVDLERTPPLAGPALISSDATPEAMRDLLARNGEKLAWVSGEVDAAQLLGTRYANGGGANFDLLLKAFTGEAVTAHRIGRDVTLDRPALALALFVQPAAVAEVLRDRYARDRGLVPRLCLIAPASRMGTRTLHPADVPPELVQWWGATLCRLLDLPWPGRVILTANGPKRSEAAPHTMQLTAEAGGILDVLRKDIESRIGDGGDLRPVCGYASKLPGVVARIALTFEAMQDPAAEFITADTMRAACEWAPFLLAHFRAVLGDAAESAEVKLARRLLAHVKRKNLAALSANDALQALDGNGLTKDELRPALDLLIEGDWLRELPAAPHGTGRKPSPRYAVNPAALA